MLGVVKGTITNFVVRKVKKLVPKYNLPNTITFKEAISGGQKFKLKEFVNEPNDVILHQYTGGTTGLSKGAMLTNRNLVTNMLQMHASMITCMKEKQEVCLSPLPMYHIFAFTVNCLAMIRLGAKTVLVANARDIKSVLAEFNKNKITLFTGLNTLYNAMLNHPDFAKTDFSHLKIPVAGGMAMQKAVSERWEAATKVRIVEGYGMTETSPVITVNPMNGDARIGSIGIPVPNTEVRLVDDNNQDVPQGERGEIIVRAPQVMKGYYNRPEETAKIIVDGWLHTGDVGIMDETGFFTIVDRKKDMILVSGFNVYPNEIEDELAKNPKILEAAAVGIPDEKSGEVVKVFVVKKDESLTKEEVIDYCKGCLTGYKIPKEVEFRSELPKTNVGKILRRKLRDNEA
jgi:long-chain acyl-CoA synthetase